MGVDPNRGTILAMSGSATLDAPPKEALELRESISLVEAATAEAGLTKPDGSRIELGYNSQGEKMDGGVFDAKGRVPLHIIRPGIGKGRGSHLYEARMLEEAAPTFTGWKMFLNHLSPEAKKAAAGLPRDVRDLGGRVQESWWDGNVPENRAAGHGQGSVLGMVRPVRAIRDLIDDDPELIEASISASATGVRPVVRDGQRVWLVEGINPRGSVDWVTEAGAGGRIAPLLQEAYADEEAVEMALLESMTDDEILNHLHESRPGLLEEARKTDPDDDGDNDAGGKDDALESKVEALKKKGMPEKLARKVAQRQLSESNNEGDDDVAEVTPEILKEALQANPTILVEAFTQSGEGQVFLSSLVEAKIEEERETLRAESKADVDRAFELAKMEKTAHEMIAESRLPESWQSDLKARFSLSESNSPSPALDITPDVSDDGKVAKTAIDKLRESVEAEIEKEQTRLREASHTRVRGGGRPLVEAMKKAKDDEDEDDKDMKKVEEAKRTGEKPYWATFLEEAGIDDPEKAYALEG